jgi:hypothetical protein
MLKSQKRKFKIFQRTRMEEWKWLSGTNPCKTSHNFRLTIKSAVEDAAIEYAKSSLGQLLPAFFSSLPRELRDMVYKHLVQDYGTEYATAAANSKCVEPPLSVRHPYQARMMRHVYVPHFLDVNFVSTQFIYEAACMLFEESSFAVNHQDDLYPLLNSFLFCEHFFPRIHLRQLDVELVSPYFALKEGYARADLLRRVEVESAVKRLEEIFKISNPIGLRINIHVCYENADVAALFGDLLKPVVRRMKEVGMHVTTAHSPGLGSKYMFGFDGE